MDWLLASDVTIFAFGLAALVTAVGGFVKGAVGFAQPLVMVSGMSLFLPPQIVVAGIVIPIVTANLMQVARGGWAEAWSAIKEFRLFISIVCAMILISSQFLTSLPGSVLYLVLGGTVIVLCVVQLIGWRPYIAAENRTGFSILAGTIAGVFGGISGTWGAPTVLYLLAVGTPKERQMVAQGAIYGIGAVALLAGHLRSGVLNAETIPFSFGLILPSFLGMWLGFRLGDRLDQERFRKMTLWVLVVAGLNLIRKGVTG